MSYLTRNMLWREVIRAYGDYLCDPTVRGRYHSDDFPITYYHEQNGKACMIVKIEKGILPLNKDRPIFFLAFDDIDLTTCLDDFHTKHIQLKLDHIT